MALAFISRSKVKKHFTEPDDPLTKVLQNLNYVQEFDIKVQ